MNQNQINSLVRTILQVGGGLLAAHGYSSASTWAGSQELVGAITSIVGFIWGQIHHGTADNPPLDSEKPASPSGSGTKLPLLFLLGILILSMGCSNAPTTAYQVAGVTQVSVTTAVQTYDQFAAAGKTTPAQNLLVKQAYEKYQQAFAVLCDAGAIYSASTSTNAAAAAAAYQYAALNAAQEMNDLETLIQSFGVTLK